MNLQFFTIAMSLVVSSHAFAKGLKCHATEYAPGSPVEDTTVTVADMALGDIWEPKVYDVKGAVLDNDGTVVDDFSSETAVADHVYNPRNPRYKNMFRFPLEGGGGWTEYVLLLPKRVPAKGTIRAYVQRVGHDGGNTIALICKVTR